MKRSIICVIFLSAMAAFAQISWAKERIIEPGFDAKGNLTAFAYLIHKGETIWGLNSEHYGIHRKWQETIGDINSIDEEKARHLIADKTYVILPVVGMKIESLEKFGVRVIHPDSQTSSSRQEEHGSSDKDREIAALKAQLSEAEKQRDAVKAKLDSFMSDFAGFLSQLGVIKTSPESSGIKELRDYVELLRNELSTLKENAARSGDQQSELEKKKQEALQARKNHADEKKELKGEISTLQKEVEKLRAENETLSRKQDPRLFAKTQYIIGSYVLEHTPMQIAKLSVTIMFFMVILIIFLIVIIIVMFMGRKKKTFHTITLS